METKKPLKNKKATIVKIFKMKEEIEMKIKKILKIIILIIIAILAFCFIMKNFFPAEWSFIIPHKQGDFVRVGDTNNTPSHAKMFLLNDNTVAVIEYAENMHGLEIYNPKTRKFALFKQNNSTIKNYLDAVKLPNGEILIFAICEGQKDYICTQIFNPETSHFRQGASMIYDRKYFAAEKLNNDKVFIVGGINMDNIDDKEKSRYTEYYIPKENRFEKGPGLPVEMSYMNKIIQLKNDDIYVFGCTYVSEYNCEERIYKLANNSNTFEYIDKLPCRNDDIYELKSGEIVTFCGMSDLKTINKLIVFDPKTNKIRQESLSLPDYFSSKTVLLPDDNLLFVGSATGFATSHKIHKDVRIYNHKNGNLKTLNKQLNTKRAASLSGMILKDGNLLITGSKKGGGEQSFPAEIYMFNNKIER